TLSARFAVAGCGTSGGGGGGIELQAVQVLAKAAAELRVAKRVFHGRLQVAELAATVVALAREAIGVHRLLAHQRGDAAGELELPARAAPDALEVLEDRRRQHVAADDREVRG